MFIRTAVTFFISFKFSPIVRFIAFLLIVSLVGIRVVVIGQRSEGKQWNEKHWLDVLLHTRVQCVVKWEFGISFLSNSLCLFQFNESVDHLNREMCAEWEVLHEIFIQICGEYDRLTLVQIHELYPRFLDFEPKTQMQNFLSVRSETFYIEATAKYKIAAHKTGSVHIDIRLGCVRAAQQQGELYILSVCLQH